jgi:tetrahydromethanopterin S-methyltransferase subunit G
MEGDIIYLHYIIDFDSYYEAYYVVFDRINDRVGFAYKEYTKLSSNCKTNRDNVIIIIVGVVAGIIVLVGVVVAVILFRRRRTDGYTTIQ